jgi:hypothetical protein
LGLLLFYLTAFLFAMPSVANLFQPQLNGLMFSIIADIRYFYMILMVPIVALIPDFTCNLINQVFYPGVEDILMYMSNELGGQLPKKVERKRTTGTKRLEFIEETAPDSATKLKESEMTASPKKTLRSAMKAKVGVADGRSRQVMETTEGGG